MKPEVWIAAGNAAPAPTFQRSWDDRLGEFPPGANAGRDSSRAPSSETELVKNSLHALQGVSAAIKLLREQAEAFALSPADKTTHNISTLWTFSSSTSALAKLLSEFSLAGSHRRELDHFVEFFLGAKPEPGSRRRRRRGKKEEKIEPVSRENPPHSGASGLLSQAFAAAVRTILQAHSASLNSLLGSLSRRRNEPELAPDQHGGALFGFGHSCVSLLELHLHTGELRIQLQALKRICLLDGGLGENSGSENFQSFPRGADLLTHLYTLLLEPDPVHLGLLRFLFDRTFEPYAGFIRSCIYSAALEDAHGEFILEKTRCNQQEQSTLKVRSGVNTPIFLVHSCTQILRAAQQLEVISKLPGAEDYVQALSSLKPRQRPTTADVAEGHMREDAGFKPENESGIEKMEEAVIVEVISEASDSLRDEISAPAPPEPEKKIRSYFVEEEQDEEQTFFLSGYHRGASWLDVGLPRNPFAGSNELSLYGYISTLFIDNDAWEFRSTEVNEDGLLKKLVPELAQVGLLTLPKHANRRAGAEVNLVKILLSDDNLPVIREAEVHREIVPEVKLREPDVDTVSEEVSKEPARGGGSWETWMKTSGDDRVSGVNEEWNEPGILAESFEQAKVNLDVPISVVVEKTIVQEICTQYRLVSSFAVQVLQEKLHLEQHYLALRRYYFMEVGDWADNFITALCSHKWGLVCGQHHQVEAQGMLEAALQKSSCEGDSYGERLHILRRPRDEEENSPEFVDYNRLEAFDFIELEYQLEWPLNLILTPETFRMYKSVFRLLLRVRHVVFALREISNTLQIMERRSRRASADQKHRFRALQLFRHQIGHFVTVVQFHIQSQLLHVIWSGFLHSIQHEIKDMQDLEVVHHKYLKNAVHQCFLTPELSSVKACIDSIMQCLLDFRSYLKNIQSAGDESEICSDQLSSKVVELSSCFRKNIRCLHRFHLNSEAHYQLSEFWMALDFNTYFASTW